MKGLVCEHVCLFPFSFALFTGRKSPCKYEKGRALLMWPLVQSLELYFAMFYYWEGKHSQV